MFDIFRGEALGEENFCVEVRTLDFGVLVKEPVKESLREVYMFIHVYLYKEKNFFVFTLMYWYETLNEKK